jgi:hypothetical protein
MKYLLKITTILFLALTFFACSNDENLENFSENKLTSLDKEIFKQSITVKNNTTYLSSFLFKLGINQIIVSKTDKIYNYKLNSNNGWFNLNGERVYLEHLSFEWNDNGLVLNNENYSLFSKEEKLFVVNRLKQTIEEFGTEHSKNTGLVLTALVLKEITLKNDVKADAGLNSYRSSCSIWNTYVITNSGFTRSVAQAAGDLEASLAGSLCGMQGSSCSQMGSVDTSCLWENHLCMSSSTWCCPNNDPCY